MYLDDVRNSLAGVLVDTLGLDPDDHLGGYVPPALLDLYTLLLLSKGEFTTAEDVHNAWGLWCSSVNPSSQYATHPGAGHPALVPFGDLDHDVQALDEPFLEAIQQAALED